MTGLEISVYVRPEKRKEFLNAIASSDEASFFVNLGELVEQFSAIAQVITETGGGMALPGNPDGQRSKSPMGFFRAKGE